MTLSKATWRKLGGVAIALMAWEAFAFYLRTVTPMAETIFPSLGTIFTVSFPSFGLMWIDGGAVSFELGAKVLLDNSLATIGRVLAGFLLGSAFGVVVAVAMWASRNVHAFLWPPIQSVRQVPSLALVPLFLLWFGGSETGTIIYIAWAIFVVVLVYTLEALSILDPSIRAYARTLGATPLQIIRTAVIPAVIPLLIGGFRVALGLSWAVAIAAEFLGAQSGLGRLLMLSQMYFDTGRMMVIVFLFMLYGIVFNYILTSLAYHWTKWVPSR